MTWERFQNLCTHFFTNNLAQVSGIGYFDGEETLGVLVTAVVRGKHIPHHRGCYKNDVPLYEQYFLRDMESVIPLDEILGKRILFIISSSFQICFQNYIMMFGCYKNSNFSFTK